MCRESRQLLHTQQHELSHLSISRQNLTDEPIGSIAASPSEPTQPLATRSCFDAPTLGPSDGWETDAVAHLVAMVAMKARVQRERPKGIAKLN
jgi:hypothetical protein